MLGICLFALTSSFQACLQTTFPEIHRSQVASPSGRPVGGTCTKIVFPPVSTKAALLESSRTSPLLHPPRPHSLSHPHPSRPPQGTPFPTGPQVPWSGKQTPTCCLSGPSSGCGFLLCLISARSCRMAALSALPAPLKPVPYQPPFC